MQRLPRPPICDQPLRSPRLGKATPTPQSPSLPRLGPGWPIPHAPIASKRWPGPSQPKTSPRSSPSRRWSPSARPMAACRMDLRPPDNHGRLGVANWRPDCHGFSRGVKHRDAIDSASPGWSRLDRAPAEAVRLIRVRHVVRVIVGRRGPLRTARQTEESARLLGQYREEHSDGRGGSGGEDVARPPPRRCLPQPVPANPRRAGSRPMR